MKKLLFLLACTTFVCSTQAEAKSVKLGRTTQLAGVGTTEINNGSTQGEDRSCIIGDYKDGKLCKRCSDKMVGCKECSVKTDGTNWTCTKCQKGYELYTLNGIPTCKQPSSQCSNGTYYKNDDGGPFFIGADCTNVDIYGKTATYYTPNAKTDYGSFNVRYWKDAEVIGQEGINVRTLKSTYNTSSKIDDLANAQITFKQPVKVTGTVILQEALSNVGGVTMNFPQGLSGNPNCVVDKLVPSSGCGYASCSQVVDTNTTCHCTTSKCEIDLPTPVSTCSNGKTFYWNANGAMTVPAKDGNNEAYVCVDGYGASSSTTMPANATFNRVNIRFWNGANVMNAFNTTELASRDHTSSQIADFNPTIHFKNKVKTNKVVLQEATNSTKGNRKGVTMFFDAGLEPLTAGSTVACEVVKLRNAPGTCQWASCSEAVDTDAECSCNSAKCEIADPPESVPASCNAGGGNYYINKDGDITVPSGKGCVDTYGAHATVNMPNDKPTYNTVNIRMWDYATVNREFTTGTLKSLSNTASHLNNLQNTITFKNKVKVTSKVILSEATSSTAGARKGTKMVFEGGLDGNPTCEVQKQMQSSGCGYASCQASIETSATCTCTNGVCQIVNDSATSCQSGYAWREKRTGDGAWAAGCYPIGTCEASRPDLVSGNTKPTCMFINAATGKGQCKTDNVWTSTECTAN